MTATVGDGDNVTSNSDRVWKTDIGHLVSLARLGLVALVPVFDQARIEWKGDQTYDDFERIAEAIYDSIVRDSIMNATSLGGALPPARYGVMQPDRELSRVLVDPSNRWAFHEFETDTEPFDSILCLRVGEDGRDRPGELLTLPFDGQQFVYEARYGGEAIPTHYQQIEVLL